MKRNFIAGLLLGAAVVAAPAIYMSKSGNAFEIDSSNSSVIKLPGPATLKDSGDIASDFPAVVTPAVAKDTSDGSSIQALQQKVGEAKKAVADFNDDHIRDLVRDLIKSNPDIVLDVVKSNPQAVIDSLNAFATQQRAMDNQSKDTVTLSHRDILTASQGYPFLGNKDGTVEIAYYFDVNCHYCKGLEPKLVQFVKDNPDVKLVMREMPILAPESRYAAEMAGILFDRHPDKYAEFHQALMDLNPGMGTTDIDNALIAVVGEDEGHTIIASTLNAKLDDEGQAVAQKVTATLQTAQTAGITGTPFVIVKDTDFFLRGAADDAYQQLAAAADIARKKHATAQ